jgi:hypothetical protein
MRNGLVVAAGGVSMVEFGLSGTLGRRLLYLRRSVRALRDGIALRRVTLFLLVTALLGPSAFALWAAIASYEAGVAARQASKVPERA